MNVHDSEKLENLLHHAGLSRAAADDDADLLIINTCSIRDKAEQHLYSDLGKLRSWKAARPGRALGVGGCVAQQVGDAVLRRFQHVDFVFGTHNLRLVPSMVEAAFEGERSVRVEESRSQERFDLPERHPGFAHRSPGRAFVTVMEGCDMYCSFCIVPLTRGREISRPAASIEREVRDLAERGVSEITLLGQTVNAYGRHDLRRGNAVEAGTVPFADLLARLDAVPGIERIRYTSPHPIFFDDALARAHGSLERLCPHVHLPLQSGSSAVLEAMRRRYTRDDFLAIAARLRASRSDLAITTDLIVGFPGETDADFEDTLSLVREVGFVDSYSFKYSPRPGTRAADLAREAGAVEPGLAQERLARLQSLQRELTLDHHHSRVGGSTRILVEGESRRGAGQVCGRDPWHRVVNVEASGPGAAPGAQLEVEIVAATPHSLIGELVAEGRAAQPRPEIRVAAVKPGGRSADEQERNAASATRARDPLRVI